MPKKKKNKTIFREILLPLLSVLVFEMLFMAGVIFLGGVIEKIDQNAMDMLAQQTENRGNYLLTEMIGNWSSLQLLSNEIDTKVQERLDDGRLSLADLNKNGEACSELLGEISPELVDTMYNKKISGIFVIFNTQELTGEGQPESLPGIYLRDLDPKSVPSEKHADLLWERAPVSVVKSGYIAMDSGWLPAFPAEDIKKDFFSKPFRTAYEDKRGLAEKEYGYWTTQAYSLNGDNRTAIAYSLPLILDNGTVYGVLGIELLTDYVQSLLPNSELMEGNKGSYILAVDSGETQPLTPVVLSGTKMDLQEAGEKYFTLRKKNYAEDQKGEYYAAAKRLVIYSNNAPFDSDEWYLLGVGSNKDLFAFSRQIQNVLFLSLMLTAAIGIMGIMYASYRLSKPIRRLSEEVAKAQKDNRLPVLPATGILEIDRFADSISRLSREVVESSTRFLSIMDMASVELAGYELREDTDIIYVTDNFFPMLGVNEVDTRNLTKQEFLVLRHKLHNSLDHSDTEDGSIIYSVPLPDDNIRYLRSENKIGNGREIGLIEDVTASTLEKIRIEQERDSDLLTKLYARRGFKRESEKLFSKPAQLKHAGLLMIDLDNLKKTNDKFGHNFGDLYIQTAGKCFVDNTPKRTLCARMAGDEFILFFYGYDNQEEIREKVEALYQAIRKVEFILPNGENIGLSASGGLAWYPENTCELPELMKYADFAMYQVKRSLKGTYTEFNAELYSKKLAEDQCRLELHQMLETEDVNYFFQPIFESRTGSVYAYEALMRVNLPTLRSPETVVRLAREEGRMADIERITLFRATESYEKLLEKNAVSSDALLFINSIANVCMTMEEEQQYHERFADLQRRIVIEITEEENLDSEQLNKKRKAVGFSGMFALDDYGSGYNSEINLLELNPNFVKVDMTIVRDVDKDANKQQIISNIVNYAHKRDILIIAEGLETAEELRTALALGVDLFQGYFLAKPGATPPNISDEALQVIGTYWAEAEAQ